MLKTNVVLKESINLVDKVKMTTELADSYFLQDSQTGEWKYAPYFADLNTITAFFLYCVDGLEFEMITDESGNSVMEPVYDAVLSDEEVFGLYTEILDAAREEERIQFEAYEHKTLLSQFLSVLADVADMVDFRKQQLMHQKRDSVDEFFQALTAGINAIDFKSIDFSKLLPHISAENIPVEE